MHPDIQMTMQTGYRSVEYLEYEKEVSCSDKSTVANYDDANILFTTLEEEKLND